MVKLQLVVSVGCEVTEVFVQHHFEQTSNSLFKGYIETFFDIKREAAARENIGLKQVSKLMINSPTGKVGYNPEKQRCTKILKDHAE